MRLLPSRSAQAAQARLERARNSPILPGRSESVVRAFLKTWAAGPENFELDHFRPKSLFPHLLMSYYNLYWSCHVCNRLKTDRWPTRQLLEQGIGYVDLCASTFQEHFVVQKNGKWRGKTLSAKYTIDSLRLNRPHLVELRVLLRELALE